MRVGQAIEKPLLQLRQNVDRLQDRGDACGLLLDKDEPLGYVGVPDEFRAFLAWGVDEVHDGLWIDDPNQRHAPYVAMASPMDFAEPILIETTNASEFLSLVELSDVGAREWEVVPERAAATRRCS